MEKQEFITAIFTQIANSRRLIERIESVMLGQTGDITIAIDSGKLSKVRIDDLSRQDVLDNDSYQSLKSRLSDDHNFDMRVTDVSGYSEIDNCAAQFTLHFTRI